MRGKILTAVAVAAVMLGGAGTALAVTGSSAGTPVIVPAGTVSACVTEQGVLVHIYQGAHTACPTADDTFTWSEKGPKGNTGAQGIQGVQGPKGDQGIQGPQGPAGPSDLTVTASTSVSNRDDSGGQGNWAKDSFVRTITITRHEAAPVGNCGGGTTCWFYTGTITDSGTFMTGAGDKTPNASCTEPAPSSASCSGLAINGQVAGNFTGGSHIEFYASSDSPDASLVPSTLSGDVPSTGDWYQQFFHNTVSFSGAANLIDWSWTYSAPNTCEQWVDAFNNGDGQGTYAADGNIAGINQCPV